MKTTSRIALLSATLVLAAPAGAAQAQDLSFLPGFDSAPPALTPPAEETAVETPVPLPSPPQSEAAAPPAETPAAVTEAPQPTAQVIEEAAPAKRQTLKKKKSCARKRGAAKRKCKRARRVTASASAAGDYWQPGQTVCYAGDGIRYMYTAPAHVSSTTRQWIATWTGSQRYLGNYGQTDASDWVGPFWSHTDYPGWYFYAGSWRHQSTLGSWTLHYMDAFSSVGGYQVAYFHGTGAVGQSATSASGCSGSNGYFNGG
jgi:hypothetical protein